MYRDSEIITRRAAARHAPRPRFATLADPSFWALTLLRSAAALRATTGSSAGLSTALRVLFHIDVWTDHIGPGLSLPHPFNVVIGGGAVLGSDCTVLHGVTIQQGASTTIGRGAVLGVNSVVLANAQVGEGSVIGASSVVRGAVPDGHVAVGAPARVIRKTLPREAA